MSGSNEEEISEYRKIARKIRGELFNEKDYMERMRPEKIRLQMEYVRNHSLWVDSKIILQTMKTILLR